MTHRSRPQLVLDLRREEACQPVDQAPRELVQALADLLLEALGTQNEAIPALQEACDASEDHA